VQTNVEDQRLGIDAYALSKLEVNIIERKWGQGAKAIGGEVRLKDIEKLSCSKNAATSSSQTQKTQLFNKPSKTGFLTPLNATAESAYPKRRASSKTSTGYVNQAPKSVPQNRCI